MPYCSAAESGGISESSPYGLGVAGVAVALAELVVVFMCLLFTVHTSKSQDLGFGIPRKPLEGEFDIYLFYLQGVFEV